MTTTQNLPEIVEQNRSEVDTTPVVTSLKTWNEVVSRLDSNNGVCVVKMEALREIDGYGRLGVNVRQAITETLNSMGVGLIRNELPSDASANVVLLRLGTPAAEIVGLIKSVTANEGRENYAAEQLRRLNQIPDPVAVSNGILNAIRSLGGAVADTNIDVRNAL